MGIYAEYLNFISSMCLVEIIKKFCQHLTSVDFRVVGRSGARMLKMNYVGG